MNKNQIILISGGFVVVTVITYVFFAYHYKLFPFGKSTVEGNNNTVEGNNNTVVTDTIGNLKIVDFKNMLKTGLDISNDEIVSELTLILATLFNLNDTEIFKKIKFPLDKNDSHVLSISDAGQKLILDFIKNLKSELTEDVSKGSKFLKEEKLSFISDALKEFCDKDNTSEELDVYKYNIMGIIEKGCKELIDLISKAMESEDNVLKANDAIKNATTKKYKLIKKKALTENFPTSTETPITLSLLEIIVYDIIFMAINEKNSNFKLFIKLIT